MKKIVLFSFLLLTVSASLYSQSLNPADLIGTWEQSSGKHPATIQFVDSVTVRYSYKGHSGTTRDYYYLINNTNTPAVLTVDYSKKHNKHRNEYLVQLTGKDTLKLQVLYKKDSREHFLDPPNDRSILLVRSKPE